MKLLKNKVVIGLLCIALGLTIVYLAVPEVANAQNETVEVYTAMEDIPEGTVLTAEMMQLTKTPKENTPENTASLDSSVGQYAASLIYAGDVITTSKLKETYETEDTYSPATSKDKMVVSISVSDISEIAAARIQPGDVVMVLALPQTNTSTANAYSVDSTGIDTGTVDSETTETDAESNAETVIEPEIVDITEIEPSTVIYPEIKYMEVAAIVASEGENAKVDAELGEDDENNVPVTVSLYASEEQAKRLAELEKNGTAYMAFVARGEDTLDFIPEDEKVLDID